MKRKYWFDEAYDKIFVRPAYWMSETFTSLWMDRKVIDGVLHFLAYASIVIGSFFRNAIDKPIVNGFGDWLSEAVKRLGFNFRIVQTGKVQQYMIMGLVTIAAFAALFYYLLVAR